ncbi:MAG: prolipoprotein diacylglyceryl transferase family protein [Anaerolineae bacterium]
MFPYLLRTDSGFIYTFTAVWIVGLLFSAWLIYQQDNKFAGWDGLLAAGVVGLLCGRLQFVWQNGEWFSEQSAERWNLLQGGFGYAGVILGGLIGLFLWSLITRFPLKSTWIMLASVMSLLYFTGWLACWFDGCGYGANTFINWYAAPLPDNFGLITVRYRTQLAGMLLSIVVSLWLAYRHYIVEKRIQQAAMFWLLLGLFSAGRIAIYQFQGDDVPQFGQFRADVVFATIIVLLSLVMIIGEGIYSKRKSKA